MNAIAELNSSSSAPKTGLLLICNFMRDWVFCFFTCDQVAVARGLSIHGVASPSVAGH